MLLLIWLVRFQYALLNSIISLIAYTLFTKPESTAKKILVVRKGNVGDLICSVDSFESIQHYFKQGTVDLLTTTGSIANIGATDVLTSNLFNQILYAEQHTNTQLFNLIKATKYDVVIELPADVDTFWNQIRNMSYFRLAGIAHGGGWAVSRTNFLKKVQLAHFIFDTEQIRLQKLLLKIGISLIEKSNYQWYTLADVETVNRIVGQHLIKTKTICIATGAKLAKKKWPMLSVKTVVEYFINKGYSVVAIGDTSDAVEINQLNIPAIKNTCGLLTVQQSAALLSMCSVCVCNDSGPMHISYSIGTPVVAIFSARNYKGKWFPPNDSKNKVLAHFEVPCAGCMNEPCSNNICMQATLPSEVIKLVETVV